MSVDFSATLPNCAPLKTRNDQIGWEECTASELLLPERVDENGLVIPGTGSFERVYSTKCNPCVPDPNSSCGQMLIAGGFGEGNMVRVPPSCAMDCCQSVTNVGGDDKENNKVVKSGLRGWISSNKSILLILLFLIALGLLLFFVLKK